MRDPQRKASAQQPPHCPHTPKSKHEPRRVQPARMRPLVYAAATPGLRVHGNRHQRRRDASAELTGSRRWHKGSTTYSSGSWGWLSTARTPAPAESEVGSPRRLEEDSPDRPESGSRSVPPRGGEKGSKVCFRRAPQRGHRCPRRAGYSPLGATAPGEAGGVERQEAR